MIFLKNYCDCLELAGIEGNDIWPTRHNATLCVLCAKIKVTVNDIAASFEEYICDGGRANQTNVFEGYCDCLGLRVNLFGLCII